MVREPARADLTVRRAEVDDVETIARLLHDFNREFDVPTPATPVLVERVQRLLAGDTIVLLGGTGPDGLALLRFRLGLWSDALESYLAELYVVPDRRGGGLGRALVQAALAFAHRQGADHMELATGEPRAQALYERLGFTCSNGRTTDYFYQRDLP